MVDETDGRSKERKDRKDEIRKANESAANSLKNIAKKLGEETAQEAQTKKLDDIAVALQNISRNNIGEEQRANRLQSTFEQAVQILESPQSTPQEIELAQQTIDTLEQGFSGIREQESENALRAAQAQFDSARQMIEAINSQGTMIDQALSNDQVSAQLDALIANSRDDKFGTSTEDLQALRDQFAEAQQTLENPESSPEAMEQAQGIIDAIRETAGSEEERREAGRAAAQQASLLGKISAGIDAQTKAYDDFVGSATGGGLIAALGAAAILFTDPETIMSGITSGIEAVINTIEVISAFISGDFQGGLDLLGENFSDVTGVIGAAALFLFRKVIFGAIINAVSTLLSTVGTTIVTSLGTALAGVGAATIAAVGAMVINIINAFIEGFSAYSDTLEETGSITAALTEGFATFAANLLAWPFDLIKDLISWTAGLLGFEDAEETLDSFSFVDMLKNGFKSFGGWLGGVVYDIFNFDLSGMIQRIKDKFSNMLNNAIEFVTNIDFMEIIQDLPQRIIGIATAPIDMLKDMFAKILSFFGMEEEAEALEGFSVSQFFIDIFDKITSTIRGIFTSIGEALSSVELPSLGDIASQMSEGLKSILRSLLPDPDADLLSAEGVAARLIPQAVYDYAGYGAPAETEARLNAPQPTGGDQLQNGQTANAEAANELDLVTREGAVNMAVTGGARIDNRTTTYNSNGGGRDRGRAQRYNTVNQ